VTRVKIDPDQVAGYAKAMVGAADQLSGSADALRDQPLTNEAFGELGRQVRTAEAYARASATLLDQLAKAVDTLHTASANLTAVVSHYSEGEQDRAQTIKRAEHA